jgi:A/G-specific adenine glycosylase
MLQQTQVSTVIPYFERFMARFPDVVDLAAADLDEVLHLWTGLGYYARARNLHRAARCVAGEMNGRFPATAAALEQLPGIGRSTAGAIAAIACGQRAAILDGNVKRVLARFHAVPGHPGQTQTLKDLWAHAEEHTPCQRVADYTQAIMDLGATVCTRSRPACERCPLADRCEARSRDAVDRFPQRRPAKVKPSRTARMFLIIDSAGACLLEQRPPDGLWGGLWTPPERPADTPTGSICAEFSIDTARIAAHHEAPGFRHTFSHFHLDIQPVYVRLLPSPPVVMDRPGVMWFAPDLPQTVGLSAPAAKLLASLSSNLQELQLT